MKQRRRIYYSDSQKALMWERWKQGATLHRIAQLFDRSHSSVHRILAETGGIRPPERQRSGDLQVPDLGSRQGAGRSQTIYDGDGHPGLLL